jgi:hypothetical protein
VRLWKWLGVAGVTGVAATGVVIVRDRRKRAQLSPDEVRDRLRQRFEESEKAPGDEPDGEPDGAAGSATRT